MRLKHEDAGKLLDAILSLKTREETMAFLEDLCTIQEINSMVQRYDVALLLDQYDVDAGTANRDVDELLAKLTEMGLVLDHAE